MSITPITAKQKAFADQYLVDFNATNAAKRAGFSKKTAAQIGYQLLHKTSVQQYIAAKFQKSAAKIEVSQERTLLEIARIAFSDPRNLFNADGHMKGIHELSDDTVAAVSTVEADEVIETKGTGTKKVSTKTITRKVKLWSKTDGLDMLAKHFGLFKNDNDQRKPDPVVDISKASPAELKALLALKKKLSA